MKTTREVQKPSRTGEEHIEEYVEEYIEEYIQVIIQVIKASRQNLKTKKMRSIFWPTWNGFERSFSEILRWLIKLTFWRKFEGFARKIRVKGKKTPSVVFIDQNPAARWQHPFNYRVTEAKPPKFQILKINKNKKKYWRIKCTWRGHREPYPHPIDLTSKSPSKILGKLGHPLNRVLPVDW